MTATKAGKDTRILAVGCKLSHEQVTCADFYTPDHFGDFDIVIIDPMGCLRGNEFDYRIRQSDNELNLDYGPAEQLKKRLGQFAANLNRYFERGGFVLVFARHMPTFEVPDGVYNRTIDINDFFPWGGDGTRTGRGKNIQESGPSSTCTFFANTKGVWAYEAVIEPERLLVIAHVVGDEDEAVGLMGTTANGGFCVITPVAAVDKLGSAPVGISADVFVESTVQLYRELTAGPTKQTTLQEWCNDYRVAGEADIEEAIENLVAERSAIETKISDAEEALSRCNRLKLLFAGGDTPLEQVVDNVLTELGFDVEPGPKKRVDRKATFKDKLFAIEVQGTKGGIKEDHVRALNQWVADLEANEGKDAKGILVGNPFKETKLVDRTGNPWPGDTLRISEQRGHCAITGIQLLGLYSEVCKSPERRDELVQQILDTEGPFEGFEDWSKFVDHVEPPEDASE